MKQKFNFNQTLKQTFKLNQTMINSLDFLKIDNNELAKLINDALQTNPFLETQGFYNKEDDKFLESISSPSSLSVDLYKQLLTISLSYDEHIMSFLINSLNDKGFLSYNESEYLPAPPRPSGSARPGDRPAGRPRQPRRQRALQPRRGRKAHRRGRFGRAGTPRRRV